jgi:hypothetical protein
VKREEELRKKKKTKKEKERKKKKGEKEGGFVNIELILHFGWNTNKKF